MLDNKYILYAQERPNDGCNQYRIRNPIRKMIEQDVMACGLSSYMNLEERNLWIDRCDIFFTQLAKAPELLSDIIANKESGGKRKFVIDYDDDIFSVNPYSPAYENHGYQEVDLNLPDGKKVEIRDGKNGFNIKRNKELLKVFGQNLMYADMVITPSSVLAGKWRRLNKNVRVIKNFIDLEIWSPLNLIKDDQIRILWQGGDSHFVDMHIVADALQTVMTKFKNVHLVVMGVHFAAYTKKLPKDRVHIETWVPMEVYPWKVKTLNADIGICPLANTEFNICKSELKWEEYSALRIPSVCSNIPPYSLNVKDGKTGYLCSDTKDWVDALTILVGSETKRKELGNNAREYIEQHYDLDKNAYRYLEAFESLFKPELLVA